jgi:hypothetical protein
MGNPELLGLLFVCFYMYKGLINKGLCLWLSFVLSRRQGFRLKTILLDKNQ